MRWDCESCMFEFMEALELTNDKKLAKKMLGVDEVFLATAYDYPMSYPDADENICFGFIIVNAEGKVLMW